MRRFIIGPNPSPHANPDTESTIVENYPHERSNYCQVWAISERDALTLYHELGNYLIRKNADGETTRS